MAFLKGTKNKEELQTKEPQLYVYFTTFWDIKHRHEVPGLLSKYFTSLCAVLSMTVNTLFADKVRMESQWNGFQGGAQATQILLPIAKPDHPWPVARFVRGGHFAWSVDVDTTSQGMFF